MPAPERARERWKMQSIRDLPVDVAEELARHHAWHRDWPEGRGANLRGADLRGADLGGVDLRRADLGEANLRGADLAYADLAYADLRGADLRGANLTYADLRGADLRGADLADADLTDADLTYADLGRADLRRADLTYADLRGAKGLAYQIPQEGELIVWKRTTNGPVKLRIPPEAKRTASIVGRKCRAEFAEVLEGTGESTRDAMGPSIHYAPGLTVHPDSYDPDPRIECSHGIHFYLTREECE